MHCLWCDQQLIPEMSWRTILFLSKQTYLCETCECKLELLEGERCNKCSRISEKPVCSDCLRWEQYKLGYDPLVNNYSVFVYNEAIQEVITRWKYRGDYCLGDIFKVNFYQAFKQHFNFLPKETVTVPIPLSAERLKDRGFNQAKMLADFLPLPCQEIITRIDGEKQSKKTRKERIFSKNPFTLTKNINKPIILVDDIYTTGTTLRHAAELLKEGGCPNIYAYTLIRG
ncbi:ComF family protein [Lentibacillus sp. Marseille-P4043]|uniref:ComF family protein n=1 Tax=Lentibacillus sp. Marseille-P4043 TaxID=2040293 RepID=UPI000D0AC3EA|nr:ComF family protein [Lentibacillus sp. Marseille-P4043]